MKTMGAILLVAGTCIGSGMIALPLVLAQLGLIPSFLLMGIIWFVMYYTSLINLELNLQAGEGLSLAHLGKRFSGPLAESLGLISLKILSYSLLAVFIYGGSSIVQQFLEKKLGISLSFNTIASYFSLTALLILFLPLRLIDYINRILFFSLIAIVLVLIIGLAVSIHWKNLPLFSLGVNAFSVWAAIIPVVFTSFGFQVIFHTLTNYCKKNSQVLKRAFFWGSLIPAIIYVLWTSSILSVVFHEQPEFYLQMQQGKGEVGQLIQVLSEIAQGQSIQLLIWVISLLAIVTSVIGVGVGLFESIRKMMPSILHSRSWFNDIIASLITIIPAYLAVIFVPNAFIAILGFAGMILAFIAILLPVYLFWKMNAVHYFYPELRQKWLIYFSVFVGFSVIGSMIYNTI